MLRLVEPAQLYKAAILFEHAVLVAGQNVRKLRYWISLGSVTAR
jgi:hypothetical protein